jgi:hypothetical protein
MRTCIICRFDTELDDIVTEGTNWRCICLRCFVRETDNQRPMPKSLRRELIVALSQIEAA